MSRRQAALAIAFNRTPRLLYARALASTTCFGIPSLLATSLVVEDAIQAVTNSSDDTLYFCRGFECLLLIAGGSLSLGSRKFNTPPTSPADRWGEDATACPLTG